MKTKVPDCGWCRKKFRVGEVANIKEGKVYCPHHEVEGTEPTIIKSKDERFK
jgi:hypothetical protein